jgi:hypothetical protein
MIILFDSGQMTCESFKSNGLEEGGEEEMLEVADVCDVLLSLLLEPLFFGSVELLPFISDILVDDAELFNGDFILDEDDEVFSSVEGFAGTKRRNFEFNHKFFNLNSIFLPLGGVEETFSTHSNGVGIGGFRMGFFS